MLDTVSVPCRGIISYSKFYSIIPPFFHPFPSPVGGLSLIHSLSIIENVNLQQIVSVPCRGIISYSKNAGIEKRNNANSFRPLSGDYLLFNAHGKTQIDAKQFPSPVGGLSLIRTTKRYKTTVGCCCFRPLSGDYLLFIRICNCNLVCLPCSSFRPLSGDYLLF